MLFFLLNEAILRICSSADTSVSVLDISTMKVLQFAFPSLSNRWTTGSVGVRVWQMVKFVLNAFANDSAL